MAKDQRKKQKQLQKKAAKHKAKRSLQKKKEITKSQNDPRIILDKVDYALELAEMGDFENAFKIINKLIKKYPANADVQFGQGVLLLHSDNVNEAIGHFDKAIEIDPSYVTAHFNRAAAYQLKADIMRTADSLRNVISLQHLDSELANQAQEKLDILSDAITRNGGITLDQFIEAQTNFEIGFAHMEQQNFSDAIEPLKLALSINPDPPQTYGNLGLCYAFLGEKEIALDYFNKALELDPKYEVALVNRSLVEKLDPGDKLDVPEMKSVNYYLDYSRPKD